MTLERRNDMMEYMEQVFEPEWLRSALLLALFSTAVVVGVFTYLNRFTKKSYFNLWTVAWIFYGLWLGACIRLEETPDVPSLIMARRACIGISALCMFWGSLDLVNHARRRSELGYGIILILLWSYAGAYHVKDRFWITMPVFALLAGASIWTGFLFLRYHTQYRGASLLGWGFVFWGLHLFGFPVQSLLSPSVTVLAYFMTAALALFVALGMIVFVVEEAQERHQTLLDEFKRGIANRRQLEQEIVISEQKYRALFHAASDAIFLVDLESLAVLDANEKAGAFLGTKNGGKRLFPDICPDLRHGMGTVVQNRHRVDEVIQASRECRFVRADGATVPCEGSVTLVEYNRRPVLLITVREISERKKLEQQLRQSEKLSALGQLVAGVAHELNNPLAVIMGYAQILTGQDCPPGRVRGELQKILHESERAAKIVRNLLTFARPREPQLAPTDINQLLLTIIGTHEAEMESNAIQCRTLFAGDLPKTMADPHQIEQVLTNLLTNAIQAMSVHHGARLLEIATERAGATLRITMSDTGPGIPSEAMPKIFDPFYTTKGPGKGTGLGLSICHSILQEHHGRILVESEEGKGAKFIIELPLIQCTVPVKASAGKPVANQRGPVKAAGHHRILLVDDEPGIVEVLASLLGDSGYTIESAHNGKEALDCMRAADYDLIISDLCMPDLGGEALYERIRAISPALASRIIFITGDTVSGSSRQFLEGTGNRWFGKPFNLDDIERTVAEILNRSSSK